MSVRKVLLRMPFKVYRNVDPLSKAAVLNMTLSQWLPRDIYIPDFTL